MRLGFLWLVIAFKEKAHDCRQPWALAEIGSSATRPGVNCDDDDQIYDLLRRRIHQHEK